MAPGLRFGLVALAASTCNAIDNGRGVTPPMGWRSWNLYGANVDQKLIETIMDGMVSRKRTVDGVPTSLCDLGYCDVGLDDAWQKCGAGTDGFNYHAKNAQGKWAPVVNEKFPDMAAMTEHAHNLGLTAGWYGNNCQCAERHMNYLHLFEYDNMIAGDVDALVKFGFDGIKLDGCGRERNLDLWSRLINKTGRTVTIENCHWGQTVPTKTHCPWNFFRTSMDIRASYSSIVTNLQTTVHWAQQGLSRPGCWAYPDMMQVGCAHGPGGDSDPGLTFAEARSHFGAWCIVSSPLTLSHDVNNDTVMDAIWPLISNKEALAVNQAWAGHSGSPLKSSMTYVQFRQSDLDMRKLELLKQEIDTNLGLDADSNDIKVPSWQIFYKPLSSSKVALLFMNHDSQTQDLSLSLADVPTLRCGSNGLQCGVRDIWNHKDEDSAAELKYSIEGHDSVFVVVTVNGQSEITV